MRVLTISEIFPRKNEKTFGIFVSRLLSELARQGVENVVVVPAVWCPSVLRLFKKWRRYYLNQALLVPPEMEGIVLPCLRLPGNWFNRWWGWLAYWRVRSRVRALHAEKKFDVIYGVGFFPGADIAVRLGRDLGIPSVGVGTGTDVNMTSRSTPTLAKHFSWMARGLDGAIARGKSVAERIDEMSPGKSRILYGMVDMKEFRPSGKDQIQLRAALDLPNDRLIFLYAGRLVVDKGLHELVEAFCSLRKKYPETLLVICGHGPESSALHARIQSSGHADGFRMTGAVAPEQISRWLKAADVFVLPSYMEGMPNAVMEAMACGLPVITTAVGGIPAALDGCEGAILLPPRDSGAITNALLALAGNPQLREDMARASREKAVQNFDIERTAKKTIDYFDEIISAKSKVPQRNSA